jgi:hypothetical protein
MAVSDKSGNGVVPNVGSGAGPGWSLWKSTTNGAGSPIPWGGGRGALIIAGTMGGGTVTHSQVCSLARTLTRLSLPLG